MKNVPFLAIVGCIALSVSTSSCGNSNSKPATAYSASTNGSGTSAPAANNTGKVYTTDVQYNNDTYYKDGHSYSGKLYTPDNQCCITVQNGAVVEVYIYHDNGQLGLHITGKPYANKPTTIECYDEYGNRMADPNEFMHRYSDLMHRINKEAKVGQIN